MSFQSAAHLEAASSLFGPDPDGLLEPDFMRSSPPDLDGVLAPDLMKEEAKPKKKKKHHHHRHHHHVDTSRQAFEAATMANLGDTGAFERATMAKLGDTGAHHEAAFAHYAD